MAKLSLRLRGPDRSEAISSSRKDCFVPTKHGTDQELGFLSICYSLTKSFLLET